MSGHAQLPRLIVKVLTMALGCCVLMLSCACLNERHLCSASVVTGTTTAAMPGDGTMTQNSVVGTPLGTPSAVMTTTSNHTSSAFQRCVNLSPSPLDDHALSTYSKMTYTNTTEYSAASPQDIMAMWVFISAYHVQKVVNSSTNSTSLCSELSSSELFCSVVYDTQNVCTPVMMTSDAVTGLCLEIYYIQGLLAPLLLSNQVTLVPWMVTLATKFCRLENFSGCVKPRSPSPTSKSNSTGCNVTESGIKALDHSCPKPYTRVSTSSHGSEVFRANFENALNFSRTRIATGSTVVCGSACDAKFDTDTANVRFLANLARFSFLCEILLPVMIFIVTASSGCHAALEYPNRLMVYLSIAVLFLGALLLPHFLEVITGDNIACRHDNSLESSDGLKKKALAVFSYIAFQFGHSAFRLLVLFVAFAYWQLVLKLQYSRVGCWYMVKVDGVVEAVYMLVVVVWAVSLTVVNYSGDLSVFFPIHVAVGNSGQSPYLTLCPDCLSAFISIVLLIDGYRRLHRLNHTSSKLRGKSIENLAASSAEKSVSRRNSPASTSRRVNIFPAFVSLPTSSLHEQKATKSEKTMQLLLKRFILYISAVMLSSIAELIYRIGEMLSVFQSVPELDAYPKCMVATCGDIAICKPLQPTFSNASFAILLVLEVANAMCAIIICSWVFSPSAWKRKQSKKAKTKSMLLRQVTPGALRQSNGSVASGAHRSAPADHVAVELAGKEERGETFLEMSMQSADDVTEQETVISCGSLQGVHGQDSGSPSTGTPGSVHGNSNLSPNQQELDADKSSEV